MIKRNHLILQLTLSFCIFTLMFSSCKNPTEPEVKEQVSSVFFSKSGKIDYQESITLSSSTNGAKIFYTIDGTTPNKNSKLYISPIVIEDNITIKAIAQKNGMADSDITESAFQIKKYTINYYCAEMDAPKPISGLKKGDIITDIHLPKLNRTNNKFLGWYNGNEKINIGYIVTSDLYLVAKWESGEIPKEEKVSPVEFVDGDNHFLDFNDTITMSCKTKDSTIYYTLDGISIPPENSTKYVDPIVISADDKITIKAVAIKEGLKNSDVTSKTYTIKKYKVDFNNGGHGKTPNSIINLKKGDKLTASQLEMSAPNSGFRFNKWSDESGNTIKNGHEITKDLTLTAIWDDISPAPVTNLRALKGDSKAILRWTNSIDEDFSKVIIQGGPTEISVLGKPNENVEKEIKDLTNSKEYHFIVKALDKNNNESIISSVNITPTIDKKYNTSDTPKVIDTLKYKRYDKEQIYSFDLVEFGDWPQSILKDETVLVDKYDEPTIINGWECYTDGFGNYYVKEKSLIDFEDKTGLKLTKGSDYYFKIEPIRWLVLNDNYIDDSGTNRGKLLFSEKILYSSPFCYYDPKIINNGYTLRKISGEKEPISLNNYTYSEIRASLNGYNYIQSDMANNTKYFNKGFLQKAFSKNAIIKINNTSLNKYNGTEIIPDYPMKIENVVAQETINDKIFLLGYKEVVNIDYCLGKTDYADWPDTFEPKAKSTTDYTKATTIARNDFPFEFYEPRRRWWLRTTPWPYSTNPQNDYSLVDIGPEYGGDFACEEGNGVVPALTINY